MSRGPEAGSIFQRSGISLTRKIQELTTRRGEHGDRRVCFTKPSINPRVPSLCAWDFRDVIGSLKTAKALICCEIGTHGFRSLRPVPLSYKNYNKCIDREASTAETESTH